MPFCLSLEIFRLSLILLMMPLLMIEIIADDFAAIAASCHCRLRCRRLL